MSFSPLTPLGQQGLRLHFVKLLTYTISVPLTLEIHKNNINTFRVTNKSYYKKILFQKFLSNEMDNFRELLPNIIYFFQEKFTRQYFFLSDVNLYSKSLLAVISANSTFRTKFDFTKLKITHCWNIYHFLLWIQASAFLK